jgi:transcriptional regulator GlxA family with amidase domain
MSELTIAFVLYDRMTALDAIGPMEVLRFIPGTRLEFVSTTRGPVHTDTAPLDLIATASFEEIPDPDVVVVPGGPGTASVLDGPLVTWLREVHLQTRWTTSVCSGSVVLAAAGLLEGVRATSHFSVLDLLSQFGAEPGTDRVIADPDRRIITCAGVSSGIDMALGLAAELTEEITAQAIQLVIEYDPQPPFASGSLKMATPEVLQRAIEIGRPQGAIPDFWPAPHVSGTSTRS